MSFTRTILSTAIRRRAGLPLPARARRAPDGPTSWRISAPPSRRRRRITAPPWPRCRRAARGDLGGRASLPQSWQALVDRFGESRPASIADDEQFSATVTLTDARLVGALIVIDIGSRDAAQSALAPIAETLADLDARAAPRIGAIHSQSNLQAGVGRRHVDQPQLHALRAVPAIDRQRAGGVHGAAATLRERGAELLSDRAKRDGIDDRAVARAQAHAHVRLADLLDIGDGVGGQRDHRLGVAGAERAGARDAWRRSRRLAAAAVSAPSISSASSRRAASTAPAERLLEKGAKAPRARPCAA